MGRPAGFKHNDKARQAIRTAHLVRRLDLFQEGKLELSAVQVKAIEVLLSKSLPSLQSVDSTVDATHTTKFERKVYSNPQETAVSEAVPSPPPVESEGETQH